MQFYFIMLLSLYFLSLTNSPNSSFRIHARSRKPGTVARSVACPTHIEADPKRPRYSSRLGVVVTYDKWQVQNRVLIYLSK